MQLLPHTRLLPLAEAPVTGRTRAEAKLKRQVSPRDPRVQHEQDPLQRGPIIEPLPTRMAEPPLVDLVA